MEQLILTMMIVQDYQDYYRLQPTTLSWSL
jgi:hypothetical protein